MTEEYVSAKVKEAGHHQWTIWIGHKAVGFVHREHRGIYRLRYPDTGWTGKYATLLLAVKAFLEGYTEVTE